MKSGDIARVKISGENVVVLREVEAGVVVNRAAVTRDGIAYREELFNPFELETVEQNIDREFAEVVYRQTLMNSKLKEDNDIEMAVDDEQIQ